MKTNLYRLKAALSAVLLASICPLTVLAQTTETARRDGSEATTSTVASQDDPAEAQPSDEISTATLDRQLIAELIVKYTNEQRQKHDLKPLAPDEELARLARKHSVDMATRGYFSHTGQREEAPDISFEERVSLKELGYRRTGENIALQPIVLSRQVRTQVGPAGEVTRDVSRNLATYDELSSQTVHGWMKSPGHRKNILTPEFNLIGIGVAVGEREGTPYAWITQDFGQK